jgi:hypothetical protein
MRRAEYVELCKQMTSRNPDLDYRAISDRILEILEEDVCRYIDTLPSEDKGILLKDFDVIISTIPKGGDDTNPLSIINMVSIQISILFTRYEITYKAKKRFNRFGLFSQGDSDLYNYIIQNDDWKYHSHFKKILRNYRYGFRFRLYDLVEETDRYPTFQGKNPIFMVFLGFLKLDEIVESYLNNVYFLGLSYKIEIVDGRLMYPIEYLLHDGDHYISYLEGCITKYEDTMIIKLKEYYEYVKGNSDYDKKVQYSIDFALFMLLHEDVCGSDKKTDKNLFRSHNIYHLILEAFERRFPELCKLHNLGKAIPVAYREVVEYNNTQLNEEKVMEYLDLVMESFLITWNNFNDAAYKVNEGVKERQIREPNEVVERPIASNGIV